MELSFIPCSVRTPKIILGVLLQRQRGYKLLFDFARGRISAAVAVVATTTTFVLQLWQLELGISLSKMHNKVVLLILFGVIMTNANDVIPYSKWPLIVKRALRPGHLWKALFPPQGVIARTPKCYAARTSTTPPPTSFDGNVNLSNETVYTIINHEGNFEKSSRRTVNWTREDEFTAMLAELERALTSTTTPDSALIRSEEDI